MDNGYHKSLLELDRLYQQARAAGYIKMYDESLDALSSSERLKKWSSVQIGCINDGGEGKNIHLESYCADFVKQGFRIVVFPDYCAVFKVSPPVSKA